MDRLKAEVYQSSRNARIKLFSPTATYKLMNVPQANDSDLSGHEKQMVRRRAAQRLSCCGKAIMQHNDTNLLYWLLKERIKLPDEIQDYVLDRYRKAL